MYNKIKEFLGAKPKNKTMQDYQTADQIILSRRKILHGLGALGITAVAGLNTTACADNYDYRERFSQNFNIYDYPQFKPDQQKEWQEQTGYVDKNIDLCLQGMINEDFAIKPPINKLISTHYQNGIIVTELLVNNPDQIKNILKNNGVDFDDVILDTFQHESNISITRSKPFPATFKLHIQTEIGLFIDATSPDGTGRNINLNFDDKNTGVEVFSGPTNDFKGKHVQLHDKIKIISPDNMEGTFNAEKENFYKSSDPLSKYPIVKISTPQSLITFLKDCRSKHMAELFFACHFDSYENYMEEIFPGIQFSKAAFGDLTMENLLEIFKLLPRDPLAFTGFIRFVIGYKKGDTSMDDEFRHPLETLHSGWGDCDDFTLISYFWAYLNRYTPHLVGIHNTAGAKDRHVFICYQNEQNQMVIINNSHSIVLDKGKNLESFLSEHYNGWELEFNESV